MRLHISYCGPLVLAWAFFGASDRIMADTGVTGVTYWLTDDEKYLPLEDVEIQAFRDGKILPKGKRSDKDGRFGFGVPAGGPFRVVFYYKDKVPELQELAGKDKVGNHAHVVLLTPRQYEDMAKRSGLPGLKQKLQCIAEQLPQESESRTRIEQMLKDLPGR